MVAGNSQYDMVCDGSVLDQIKRYGTLFIKSDVGCAVIRIVVKTVGDNVTGKSFVDLLIVVDIGIDHQSSVRRQKRRKLMERMTDIFQIFKEIQMILFYI